MTHQDFLLTLRIADQDLEVVPKELSFALEESIYSLYPKGSVSLLDRHGILNETLATREGTRVEIGLSMGDAKTSHKFVVDKDKAREASGGEAPLSGRLDFSLIDPLYLKQTPKSTAYSGTISQAVQSIASDSSLGVDVESTSGTGKWYQALRTDAAFLTEVLMPLAYSRSVERSPYVCFIDLDGTLHFRALQSLIRKGSNKELIYAPNQAEGVKDRVSALRRWTGGLSEHRDALEVSALHLDLSTGKYQRTNFSASELVQGQEKLLVADNSGKKRQFLDLPFLWSGTGEENVVRAIANHAQRSLLLTEHFILILAFDPTLKAGSSVKLKLENTLVKDLGLSQTLTGSYLIEIVSHVWSGSSNAAYTRLVIGRSTAKVPSDYLVESSLI